MHSCCETIVQRTKLVTTTCCDAYVSLVLARVVDIIVAASKRQAFVQLEWALLALVVAKRFFDNIQFEPELKPNLSKQSQQSCVYRIPFKSLF